MRTAMMIFGIFLIFASHCYLDPEIRAVWFRAGPLSVYAIWNGGGGMRGMFMLWNSNPLWSTDSLRRW